MTTKNPIITLRNVAMLLPFLSSEESTYYLHGIRMEPHSKGGCVLIATNGHAILAILDEDAYAPEPIVWKPSRVLIAAAQSYETITDDDGNNYLPMDGELVELTSPTMGETIEIKPNKDGTNWVDWRKAIIEAEVQSTRFNPSVLAYFAEVSRLTGDSMFQVAQCKFTTPGQKSAAWLVKTPFKNVFGAVMPLREEKETQITIPNWVTER